MSVLVVEDNDEVGQFAADALTDLGYTTRLVGSAAHALEELAAGADRFDVVFTDVVMPGMTGIELAQEIRCRHADLPVVLTSGYSHVLSEHGSYGFELLQKPYSVEQLSRVLQRVGRLRKVGRAKRSDLSRFPSSRPSPSLRAITDRANATTIEPVSRPQNRLCMRRFYPRTSA